jgi:hypothetical protein
MVIIGLVCTLPIAAFGMYYAIQDYRWTRNFNRRRRGSA